VRSGTGILPVCVTVVPSEEIGRFEGHECSHGTWARCPCHSKNNFVPYEVWQIQLALSRFRFFSGGFHSNGILSQSVLFLRSQLTRATPILPSRRAPGDGTGFNGWTGRKITLSIANRLAESSSKSMTAWLIGAPLYANRPSVQTTRGDVLTGVRPSEARPVSKSSTVNPA